MVMERPFVYISALMRTGSTVLGEALTQLPSTFIFYETHLGKNTFSLSGPDQNQLRQYGIDMRSFLRPRMPVAFILRRLRRIWSRQDFMVEQFKHRLIPQMSAAGIQQVGIKEVKHEGWRHVVRHFPDLKMVMIGRDPRDIYISAYRKWQLGTTRWRGPFTPASLADELNAQFDLQMRMRAHVDCNMVRYEDLCTDPHVISRVLQFVQSPVSEIGKIGRFLRVHPGRHHEYLLHGEEISQESIWRWEREKDRALAKRASEFASRMLEYKSVWGYK